MYPTITSLSQTSGGATSGGTGGGSQESSGPDNEQKAGDNIENKGDNNAGEDGEQQGDNKGKGQEENPDDPGGPNDQPEERSSGSVRFEVLSKLCFNYDSLDNSSHSQLLNVVGDLTIQVPQSLWWFHSLTVIFSAREICRKGKMSRSIHQAKFWHHTDNTRDDI
jgi:hypothetical protein